MSGFLKSWTSLYAFKNSMLQYVVLAEVYKENPASLNCTLKEVFLIAFQIILDILI